VVTSGRGEAGKVRFGCLFIVALVVLAVYVGKDFATVYFRYYRMKDEVKTQAAYAPALSDNAILNRLVVRAESLGVPLGPEGWFINRTLQPHEIVIRGKYNDSVVVKLPLYHRVFRFHFVAGARAPL
jgi:hypothetical protein